MAVATTHRGTTAAITAAIIIGGMSAITTDTITARLALTNGLVCSR
jgi:hypothetical protein